MIADVHGLPRAARRVRRLQQLHGGLPEVVDLEARGRAHLVVVVVVVVEAKVGGEV
jgi:hypothetical protein